MRGAVSIFHDKLVGFGHQVEQCIQNHLLVLVIFLFDLMVYPMGECIQFGDVREVLDEALVESPQIIRPWSHLISGHWPVFDTSDLDWVHLYTTFQEDEADIINHRLFKHVFFSPELEVV